MFPQPPECGHFFESLARPLPARFPSLFEVHYRPNLVCRTAAQHKKGADGPEPGSLGIHRPLAALVPA